MLSMKVRHQSVLGGVKAWRWSEESGPESSSLRGCFINPHLRNIRVIYIGGWFTGLCLQTDTELQTDTAHLGTPGSSAREGMFVKKFVKFLTDYS